MKSVAGTLAAPFPYFGGKALAADEMIRLRIALERERTCPYWRRLLGLGPDPFYVVWKEPMP